MIGWKFKKGDMIHNGEEAATVIGFDSVNNRYILSQNGLTFHRYKTIVEQMCDVLEFDIEKFKQEYNDGLVCLSGNEKRVDEMANKLGLIWTDCYNQRCVKRRDDSYRLIINSEWKCIANIKYIPFTSLLATKEVNCKDLPKIYPLKSEAELILDELEKVMDKAKVVLERSGR